MSDPEVRVVPSPFSPALEGCRRLTRRSQDGLTLVEVVFAVGILAIFLLGLFSTLAMAMKSDALTREHQAASNAALRNLDSIVSIPFGTIQRSVGVVPVPAYAFHATHGEAGEFRLRAVALPDVPLNTGANATMAGRVVVVADPAGDGSAGLLEVRVTVAWLGADNRPARVDVISRRAE